MNCNPISFSLKNPSLRYVPEKTFLRIPNIVHSETGGSTGVERWDSSGGSLLS